jgi:uncharacterized lipoprotein YmbA
MTMCSLRAAGVLVALALAGCGSTPPERVHSLLGGEPAGAMAAVNPPFVFTLSPVRLPPGTDQPQWLVRLPDDTLARLEQDRWPASLREEYRAALVEQLVRRGGIEARTAPGAPAGIRIDVDLRRFETAPGRGAWVAGSYVLALPPTAPGAPLASGSRCAYERAEAETGSSVALAAAHRRALEDLAGRIAAAVGRLRAGTDPCA